MAIPPIGNNSNTYPTVFQSGTQTRIDGAKQSGKTNLTPEKCKTWQNRKYVDRSSDPSVSFQSPTHLSPEQATAAVAAHENEHVVHNQKNAEAEGMVAHSSVTFSHAVCPEWGRIYVAGGKTTTTYTARQPADYSLSTFTGSYIDTFA